LLLLFSQTRDDADALPGGGGGTAPFPTDPGHTMQNAVNTQETTGGIGQETATPKQAMGGRGRVGDSGAVSPGGRGYLVNSIVEITVDSARGLPSVGLLSTVNSFVRLRMAGDREPFQTCVVNNDINPVWQQTYVSQNKPRPLTTFSSNGRFVQPS
jgi:hypothetical protein